MAASVELVDDLRHGDLQDLCDATEAAIKAGGGFGWVDPPERAVMERYWRGVLAVPERSLFLGRLDGVVCGSAQLVRPTRNNEAQAHVAHLTTSFVAPWARGHGVARAITDAVIAKARSDNFHILNLDVRESQAAAIAMYENMGFVLFGQHPHYARVRGHYVPGRYYYYRLRDDAA